MKFLLFALSLSFFASCCTKKECPSAAPHLTFHGFTADEIDTVYQTVNGGESELAYLSSGADTTVASYYIDVDEGFEGAVTLTVPGAGKEYVLSNFTYKKAKCNKCFPAGSDKQVALTGFAVDGQAHTTTSVDIYK